MQLFYSATSPYVRKVMACAIHRGIADRIETTPSASSTRSVTSRSPFGRNAMLHGKASAFVTTTTLIFWPSAVSYTIGVVGNFLPDGAGQRPRGATGMPRPPGISSTFFCALPTSEPADNASNMPTTAVRCACVTR